MLTLDYKIILTAILFIISIFSGLWLSKIGRPLNTPVFTVHKLAAVGFFGLLVFYLYSPLNTIVWNNILILAVTLAVLFVFGIVITGAFLSFEMDFPELLRLTHKFLFIPAVISVIILIVFINHSK